MVAFNKFDRFSKDLLDGVHSFSLHTYRVALTNTAPSSSNFQLADIIETSVGNGYSAGGLTTTVSDSMLAGVAKAFGTPVVFTAGPGALGPFRYAVLYNATSPLKSLIGWWDYGTTIYLANTETLTVTFDAVNGIFALN